MHPAIPAYDLDGARIIPLAGEFDLANSGMLETAIRAEVDARRELVVDCSAAAYIDSTVLTVLIRQKKRAGDRLRIVVRPDSHVRRIFEITGLLDKLAIVGTLEEALPASSANREG